MTTEEKNSSKKTERDMRVSNAESRKPRKMLRKYTEVKSVFSIQFEKESLSTLTSPNMKFESKRKEFLYELVKQDYTGHKSLITVTKYRETGVPVFLNPFKRTEIAGEMNSYTYKVWDVEKAKIIPYYVNFSDEHLFAFGLGDLFAQDEIQNAEHGFVPSMIRKALEMIQVTNSKYRPVTKGTPFTVRNLDAICNMDTTKIYGWNLIDASEKDVREAVAKDRFNKGCSGPVAKFQNPYPVTNLICMLAPTSGYDGKPYQRDELINILRTAYTAFRAAVLESEILGADCCIHTGNWGTGAFGNNPELIAILQMLAANLAGVKQLYYHTFDKEKHASFLLGETFFNKTFLGVVSTSDFIEKIHAKKYTWCRGDGT